MAIKRAVFSPPPGTNLGDTDFSIPGLWSASSNIRYVSGKMQPIGGWAVTNASPGPTTNVVAMLEWYAKDGTHRMALGATDTLNVLSGTTLSSTTAITPVGFVAATSNRWTMDLWGDHLIACQVGGKVYEWDLVALTAAAVTNAPTVNTVALVTSTRQLMVFGTKETVSGTFNPRCIRWSKTNDNTVWDPTVSLIAGEYVLDGSGGAIRAAKKIGDYVAVWTDDELFLGHYTGDTSNLWVFERQAVGCGVAGESGVTVADGVAYWISTELRLMAWIPGNQPFAIPNLPSYYINSTLQTAAQTAAIVWHNRRYNEIWFHPVTGSFPQTYLAVHVPSIQAGNPIWMPGSLNRSCMYQGISGVYGWVTGILKLVTHETGNLGIVNDTLSWSASSLVYFSQGQRRIMVKRLLPDVEAQVGNITFTLSHLEYPQGAETTLTTKTLAVGDDRTDFRSSGKLMRLAFSGTGATFGRLGKMTFEYEELGDR